MPAVQIFLPEFDRDYFDLPMNLQQRIQERIDRLGETLETFPHQKLKGHNAYKLRVGNYRVLYRFDVAEERLFLLTLGHRREIYRKL